MTDKDQDLHNSLDEDPLAATEAPEMEEEAESLADNVMPLTGAEETAAPQEQGAPSREAALESELAKLKDQSFRTIAELDNRLKRAKKDVEDARTSSIRKFARDLLSVSDNLRRALEAIPADMKIEDDLISGLLTGVEATERELLKSFEQNGIQKLEPLGERFDPNFHEVMFEAPMPDQPNGTIIQLVEAGYTIKGQLLRAAKVGVAKNADAPAAGADGHIINEEA